MLPSDFSSSLFYAECPWTREETNNFVDANSVTEILSVLDETALPGLTQSLSDIESRFFWRNRARFSANNRFLSCRADDITSTWTFYLQSVCIERIYTVEQHNDLITILKSQIELLPPELIEIEFNFLFTDEKLPYLSGYVRHVRQRRGGYYTITYYRHKHLAQADREKRSQVDITTGINFREVAEGRRRLAHSRRESRALRAPASRP